MSSGAKLAGIGAAASADASVASGAVASSSNPARPRRPRAPSSHAASRQWGSRARRAPARACTRELAGRALCCGSALRLAIPRRERGSLTRSSRHHPGPRRYGSHDTAPICKTNPEPFGTTHHVNLGPADCFAPVSTAQGSAANLSSPATLRTLRAARRTRLSASVDAAPRHAQPLREPPRAPRRRTRAARPARGPCP